MIKVFAFNLFDLFQPLQDAQIADLSEASASVAKINSKINFVAHLHSLEDRRGKGNFRL